MLKYVIARRKERQKRISAAFPFWLVCDFKDVSAHPSQSVREHSPSALQLYTINRTITHFQAMTAFGLFFKTKFLTEGNRIVFVASFFSHTVDPTCSLSCSEWPSMQEHDFGVCFPYCANKTTINTHYFKYFSSTRKVPQPWYLLEAITVLILITFFSSLQNFTSTEPQSPHSCN